MNRPEEVCGPPLSTSVFKAEKGVAIEGATVQADTPDFILLYMVDANDGSATASRSESIWIRPVEIIWDVSR